jgi:hypothetical protein
MGAAAMPNYYVGQLDVGPGRQAPLNQDEMANQIPFPFYVTTDQVPEPEPLQLAPPKERTMARRFTVLDNFHSDETESDYVAGLSYQANEGDDILLACLDRWISEGKVREGGPEAVMTATGETTDAPDTQTTPTSDAPPKE